MPLYLRSCFREIHIHVKYTYIYDNISLQTQVIGATVSQVNLIFETDLYRVPSSLKRALHFRTQNNLVCRDGYRSILFLKQTYRKPSILAKEPQFPAKDLSIFTKDVSITTNYNQAICYISAKEPYISIKEPYISAKEPHISIKEPYLPPKIPIFAHKSVL